MIDELKPYSDYKDSADRLVGRVPASWRVVPLKRVCTRSALYGANVPASEYVASGARFLRTTDITDDGVLRRGGVFVTPQSVHEYMLSDGDLLISRSGTVGRSFRYREALHGPCAYAGYLVRFVPDRSVVPDYLFYFTKSPIFTGFLRISAISSTIENVNGDKYANMPVLLPPPAEQAGIVRVLGAVDRRVNALVRAKRRLIELLTEQKQALITHAVTRGLDPNARLKPSGTDWLGDVPEHWRVLRAKYLLREVDERSVAGIETHLSMSQRHGLIASDSMDERRLLSDSYAGGKLCRTGDLVLNRLKAHLGVFAVASCPGVISPDYTVLRPLAGANVNFFELVLRSNKCRPELRRRAKGIVQGFWRLYTDDFYNIALPAPDSAEQAEVVAACETSTLEVNKTIESAHREIALLREYRTRLVADVVTGKLDVRDATRHLTHDGGDAGGEADEPLEAIEDGTLDTEDAGIADEIDIAEEVDA